MTRPNMGQRRLIVALAVVVALAASLVVALADNESEVTALEAHCEQDREAILKPLRDAEIAKCKADRHNDADYCDRRFKDFGNSAVHHPNGTTTPRMFADLPSCLAAFKARRQPSNSN